METYHIAFIIAVILMAWIIMTSDQKSGFVNNDVYFMSGDQNTVLEEYIIQPRLIHKVNIPAEW
jgi:hypothetical protein